MSAGADGRCRKCLQTVGQTLVHWYRQKRVTLPWRERQSDPYAVWVSEVMLQQTTVPVVKTYFEAWMKRFATVEALASASVEDVLRVWQGLGYYSRARNLHRAARVVLERYGGQMPSRVEELQQLPGVGPYTAAAIACLAFGAHEPPVDTNTLRVISRLIGIPSPGRDRATLARVREAWIAMVPRGQSAALAQAVMDLGRLVCQAREPGCGSCPVSALCAAYRQKDIAIFTPSFTRVERMRETHIALVVWREGQALVAQRPTTGLWAGLWEFPRRVLDGETETEDAVHDFVQGVLGEVSCGLQPLPPIRHSVTRYSITLQGYICFLRDNAQIASGGHTIQWMPWRDILNLPMPSPQARLRRLADERLARCGIDNPVAKKMSSEVAQ